MSENRYEMYLLQTEEISTVLFSDEKIDFLLSEMYTMYFGQPKEAEELDGVVFYTVRIEEIQDHYDDDFRLYRLEYLDHKYLGGPEEFGEVLRRWRDGQ